MANRTTNYPNGVTTAKKIEPFGEFILPDESKVHKFFEDFDYYRAADWTVTETGVATQALTDEDGGALLITNAAADNDRSFQQKVGESFLFEPGKRLWFDCRFQTNDATLALILIGLQITDTTPESVTDGVFFVITDASTDINFVVEKDSVATTTAQVGTLVDDTYSRLSFFYDGKSEIAVFVDNVRVGSSVTTNMPDDEVMTISFGVRNGEAVSKTMTTDYIFVAKER